MSATTLPRPDPAVAAVSPGPGGRALRLGFRRVRIELLALVRNPMAAVFTLAFPLVMLVIFGSVFSGSVARGVSFTEYFTAGMIASGAFYAGFQNLAIAVPLERDNRHLKRLRGTPMPPAAYFIGKTGAVIVVYAAQVAVLVGLGSALFGLHPPSALGPWLTFAWVSVLGLTACSLSGLAVSGFIRRGETAPAIVSPIVVVLQFVSGVYFAYGQLPAWMRILGSAFPLRWLALGMRSVFLPAGFARLEPGGAGWQHATTALVLSAWAVAGLLVALWRFRWFAEQRG